MSLVRQRRFQGKMNLRFFLESTVHAAYSLVHVETTNYFDALDGKKHDPQKASRAASQWIEEHREIVQGVKGMEAFGEEMLRFECGRNAAGSCFDRSRGRTSGTRLKRGCSHPETASRNQAVLRFSHITHPELRRAGSPIR